MNNFFFISPLILQTLIWPPTRLVLAFFGRFEVRGLENLKALQPKKGVIFASNHVSELDPILVPAALPFLFSLMPIFYTSRQRDFYSASGFRQIFYGGLLFKLWGAHPVHSGHKDYEKSLVNHIGLLHAGKSVLIFPEGGIQGHGVVTGKARGGVAFLASETGCPIIPLHIHGADHLTMHDFFLRKRKIAVIFGAPIFVDKVENSLAEMQQSMRVERHAADAAADSNLQGTSDSIETYKEIAEEVMDKVRAL